MEVSVQKVVTQEHLEVGIQAQVGQGRRPHIARVVDIVGDELTLLKCFN